jgi:lipopolysaccharide transport system ATP-binding protein
MSDTIISVENLSKQYRLGMVGSGTLREDLLGWWYRVRGKEDPYLKIGDTNTRDTKGNSDYVWALKDVNFEVKQGEVLGIIGKNGAGKSTLLKLLSRVTAPTTGTIKAKGRIASLLEVGTGFHPELTGKENIYLNGSIMGMKRAEINAKMDEIIDFAGVERYIDTPVKRYSSGMYVRLAFAVAAHLEPEILIVDEVLSVGDAEFQKKAIGKMEDVSSGQGRTVLFVSHNMKAVSAIDRYLGANAGGDNILYREGDGDNPNNTSIQLNYAKINAPKTGAFKTNDEIPVEVSLSFTESMEAFHLNMHIWTTSEAHLFEASTDAIGVKKGGKKTFQFFIPEWLLNANQYTCNFNFVINRSKVIYSTGKILKFSVIETAEENNLLYYGKTNGLLSIRISTKVN